MTDPNEPAFPVSNEFSGATMRALFSALVAAGLCAAIYDYHKGTLIDEDEISEDAVAIADALIEKLNKQK